MKKYLLHNHYNYDGEWGMTDSSVYNTKKTAITIMYRNIGYEISDLENSGHTVVDATNKNTKWLEEQYKNKEGDLYYTVYCGDFAFICKYNEQSINYSEYIIQEIEI